MKAKLSREFLKQYKKVNVRIRNSVDERIKIFLKNPNDPQLNNHALKREYQGYKSIDITADWRAIYREVKAGEEETYAYFTALGSHKTLYG